MSETAVEIEITDRARRYGYIIWPQRLDGDLRRLLGNRETVEVLLNGEVIGERRVAWKYRRISIGQRFTRGLAEEESKFRLDLDTGRLVVSTTKPGE